MANSAVLAGLTLLVSVPLAIGLGVFAGLRRGRMPDRIIALVTLIGTSLPEVRLGQRAHHRVRVLAAAAATLVADGSGDPIFQRSSSC